MGWIDTALSRVGLVRAKQYGLVPSPPDFGLGGNALPPLSHGYVHEPFSGAWQMNKECWGPFGLFSAVYACIMTISGDVGKLPPKIRKRLPDGSKVDYDNHPAARVLWYPNRYQTRVDFWGQFMACALYTGNAYVLLVRDDRNVISELHLLDPRRVRVLMGEDGSVFYQIDNAPLADVYGTNTFPARMIMHHRLLALTHPLVGLSPLYAAGVSAMTGQTIQQNSHAFFSNMSRASGVLTAPGKLSPETLSRLKTDWDQNFKGQQMGRTAVLDQGMKWEPLTISAADAQLLEQLKWTVQDVASCYRVPLYKITDASKLSFKNAEQQARDYLAQTLQYHLESIEARIDATFDLADSIYCEFDLSQLLRTEIDTRMSAYQTGIQSGVLTINEARRMEELPPVEGGDQPLVQSQYVPLSQAGKSPALPAPANDPPPTDTTDPADDGTDPAAEDDPADMVEESVMAYRLEIAAAAQAEEFLRAAA